MENTKKEKKEYTKDSLDDYIDHFITVHENEDVKVIGLYGKFAYIIKNKEIGWIESGYLEKI